MKMVKKLLLGLVAVAAVLVFTGCQPLENGEGDFEGNKWEAEMTIDNSTASSGYARFWKQFGGKEKVEAITTTITLDGNSNPGNSVVGFVFDLNKHGATEKDADGNSLKDTVDFCLVGITYRDGAYKYYFERYVNVPTSKTKTEANVTSSSLGNYYTASASAASSWGSTLYTPDDSLSDWQIIQSGNYTMAADHTTTMVIKLTQDVAGTYKVTIGNQVIGTYSADSITGYTRKDSWTKDGKLTGGIACYGNAYANCKIIAKYSNDKESLVGSLFADEE